MIHVSARVQASAATTLVSTHWPAVPLNLGAGAKVPWVAGSKFCAAIHASTRAAESSPFQNGDGSSATGSAFTWRNRESSGGIQRACMADG